MRLRKSLYVSHLDVGALSLRQHQLYYLQDGATDMVLHIPCLRIPRLEVHDSHLIDLGLKWYRDIQTQLPRRLNGHILQDDIGEVISLPWNSISGIEGRHKVPRMTGEREETAGAAGESLGVMHYLPFSVSAYTASTRPETEEHTAERVVLIYLWPGPGAWTAGNPWELEVEACVRGGCDVDADTEGK